MNLFLREMKAHRKSLILWNIGMVIMIGAGMGKYAGLSSSGQSMNELIAQMPKSLQAFMGTGKLDISTIGGYYGLLFLYLVLIATIHAALTGATIISKEEQDKTAEFLFVKPVSRKRIISFKLLAAFSNILIITLITWIASILIVSVYNDGAGISGDIALLMSGMFFLQILFLSIGTAIASITKRPTKAASYSTGILLVTFILSFAIDLTGKLDFFKYFTPFKYFEAKKVMFEGLDPLYMLISILATLFLVIITFRFYKKRDLNV